MPIRKENVEPTGVPGIRRHGPDRFHVVATWIDRKTGRRRKREGIAGSFEDAVVLRRRFRVEVDLEPPTRMRLGDFAPRWLAGKKRDLAESTVERYVGSLAHICERFGDYWIDAIDPGDIEDWLEESLRWPRAPATVNGWLRVLRCLFDGAIRARLRLDNPARLVRARKEGRTAGARGRALSADQLGRFLRAARSLGQSGRIPIDAARILQVIAWTGMRRGEALALMWSDVIDDELHVVRAISRGKLKTTKTDDPRIVGMPQALKGLLKAQRAWLSTQEHPCEAFIFPASPSLAMRRARRLGSDPIWIKPESSLRKPLRDVVAEGELPAITIHSLRRTYENLLRRAGVDEQVRRTMAGWRSTATQAIYAGVDAAERLQAAEALADLLQSREAPAQPRT